ncbi:hypothetical protein ACJX0J_007423, partial [Zea mays]
FESCILGVGHDSKSTMEYLNMFPAQVGEVTTMTFMTMRHFPLSLNLWLLHGLHHYIFLEEKFYEHFYIVVHETRIDLIDLAFNILNNEFLNLKVSDEVHICLAKTKLVTMPHTFPLILSCQSEGSVVTKGQIYEYAHKEEESLLLPIKMINPSILWWVITSKTLTPQESI